MPETTLLRKVPLLCRLGLHFREWRATVRRVDITNQSEMVWFKTTPLHLEARLRTSTGKCKRCSDVMTYHTIYGVEDAL